MNTQASLGMHKIFDRFDISAKVYALISMVEAAFVSVNNMVKTWVKNSNGRKELARLSPHMLKDIGLTSHDVQVEINKPFWVN